MSAKSKANQTSLSCVIDTKTKGQFCDWLISHLPPHECYVEALGYDPLILLNKPISLKEIYNDPNNEVVTLFRVIRCDAKRQALLRLISMTPYSRTEFLFAQDSKANKAYSPNQIGLAMNEVLVAHKLLIRAQADITMVDEIGSKNGKFGALTVKDRSLQELQALWGDLPSRICALVARLKGVLIENMDAYNLIGQYEDKNTLIYLRLPIGSINGNVMDKVQASLLNRAMKSSAMIMVSGEDNQAVDDVLVGFSKHCFDEAKGNQAQSQAIWLSPNCKKRQLDMFDEDKDKNCE